MDNPNGDTQDCIYDTGGKKRCIHHHPHCSLAVSTTFSSVMAFLDRYTHKNSPAKQDHGDQGNEKYQERGERDKGDDSDHNNRECHHMDESNKGEKGDAEQ